MQGNINQDGLLALYTYNIYANKLVLETAENLTEKEFAQECSPSRGSVHGLLSHMLECEAFFLAQCQEHSVELEFVDLSTLANIRRYWHKLEQEQLDFIGSLNEADLVRNIQVQLREQQLVFPVWQLLVQALIHSVHHRGELSIVLSALNHPLPTLDIILHFIKQSGQSWPYA
ncbi:MAG TPA: DinB family protein [Anaerolineales bacterium]|nr:DinB family protein [Anaerolineales bacterium]